MSLSSAVLATRFGYGLPLPQGAPTTPEAMLALLAGPDRAQQAWPLPLSAEHLPLMQKAIAAKKAEQNSADDPGFRAAVQVLADMANDACKATVARALDAPDGFRERLVAFWANHFCTVAKSRYTVYLPAQMVEEAIRPNLTGSFADLLIAATTHPSMVLFLDQNTSYGPDSRRGLARKAGLNENLAREVMELHSLGVNAPYTQTDVRQMAELLTGLTFDPQTGITFDPQRVEPGTETVLGKTYQGEPSLAPIRAVLTDLAHRPETATHIATKLARHFLSDVPPKGAVDAMTAAFQTSGGNLTAVYRALLSQPEAASPTMGKVRWPADYVVTGLRAMGISGTDLQGLAAGPFRRAVPKGLGAMGQPFLHPGGPNGFAEDADAWINPPYLAARIAWSMSLAQQLGLKGTDPQTDPQQVMARAFGDGASDALRQAVARSETKSEALGLVLASTEMNRR